MFAYTPLFYYQQQYISQTAVNNHLMMIFWLNRNLPILPTKERTLFFSSTLSKEYTSLNDSLEYFLPNTTATILSQNCEISSGRIHTITLAFFPEGDLAQDSCYLQVKKHFVYKGVYTLNDQMIQVFEKM